jgi:NAD(P)-dependent dehydrogenase (short-subunit alcohol dehydrogenase family)
MTNLEGQVILLTGATDGMGRAWVSPLSVEGSS